METPAITWESITHEVLKYWFNRAGVEPAGGELDLIAEDIRWQRITASSELFPMKYLRLSEYCKSYVNESLYNFPSQYYR